jgi:DNA-binding MarR family transcriptional regulator
MAESFSRRYPASMRSADDCTPMGPPPRALHDRLGMLLVRTGSYLTEQAEERFAEIGIDTRDYVTLAVLDGDEPRSQLELSQMTGKAPAVVVDIADGLEARGLARRERDPDDRRRSVVRLTPAGRKLLARADAIAATVEQGGLGGLDDDERAQLHHLLQRAAMTADPSAA